MCRVLSYLGQPILLQELLYKPDNSLITQSYNPKFMTAQMLNLAGFGFAAWDKRSIDADRPFIYRSHLLPFYDKNLHNFSAKLKANCLIAHVRGIEYSDKNVVSDQNVHPFMFDGSPIAFAHNGTLTGLKEMKLDLLQHMKLEYRTQISGTTDSEIMYALFLTQLAATRRALSITTVFSALIDTLSLLKDMRKKHNIAISSPLNFFISNGDFIVASRFVFDYGQYPSSAYASPHMGYHSLWYTFGEQYGCYDGVYQMKASKKMNSIIIASEPLTGDTTTWVEVPEYSVIGATFSGGKMLIKSLDIAL